MSEPRHILITGATGLLGSHALALMHQAHTLHAIVRKLPDSPLAGVRYHCIDFTTDWSSDCLPSSIDAVFHLAQSPHMRDYPAKAREIRAVNTDATSKLLAYATQAGASHFVLASTGGLYAPSDSPLLESSAIAIADTPLHYYFQTKQESEALLASYASHFSTIILRPFFMYGPRQASSMLIPRLIENVRTGKPITLHGPHGMRLNPIHAHDAARALMATLSLKGTHCFNIAGSETLTMRAVGERIGHALHKDPRFETIDSPPQDLVASNARMCEYLSAPHLSFAEGLASMLTKDSEEPVCLT